MDLSTETNTNQPASHPERRIIPILILLILVVTGIRAYPWLINKLGTLLPVKNEQGFTETASSRANDIELDTELAPIITDRDISLNESRSQQLTQFLSDLNGAPDIEVVLNSEDKILLAEAISPIEPELAQDTTASNVIVQPSSDTTKKPLITEALQSDQLSSTSLRQDNAQNIISPVAEINTASESPLMTETLQSNKTSQVSQTQDNDQQAIAADEIQASSTLKTASLLPIAKTIPLNAATDQAANSTQAAPAATIIEPAIASSINTTDLEEAISSTGIDAVKQLINTQITNWASAWSQQAVEQYFQFYTPDMAAPRHKTHEKWRAWRRNMLSRPSEISLDINKVEIVLDSSKPNYAIATFEQSYRADTYSDKITKILEMVNLDGRWLIKREKSLETL